jgi:bacterial/archaeal transporter family-2 protein
MKPLLISLLVIVAGISVVLQQSLNAKLGRNLNAALWAGFSNYLVGLVCMGLLIIIIDEPKPSLAAMARIERWEWCGGVFGAFFIGLSIILIPKFGAARFICLLVAGQMLASLTMDHFGLFGLETKAIDLPRLLGVVLLIGGVALVRT